MVIDLATINMGPGGTGKPEMSFSVTPSTSDIEVTPDEGYVFSGGIVEAVTSAIDSNIAAENIVSGVSILGVVGTAVKPRGTRIENVSIVPDQVYTENINVNNVSYLSLSITGPSSLPLSVEPSTVAKSISAPSGNCYTSVDVSAVTAAIDSNIYPGNIRSGVEILGVSGTYGGGGIEPVGTLNISSNGTYDVSVYALVDVSVAQDTHKYMKGEISGFAQFLSSWDAESIAYANANIDFYATEAESEVYDLNSTDYMLAQYLDEDNISGNISVRYPPLFTPAKTEWQTEFANCTKLITIPLYNTSNIVYFGNTLHTGYNGCFGGCTSLKTIPPIDTSSARDMYCMFVNCSSLECVPLMDTSMVQNMDGMFRGCKSLKSVPLYNTGSLTSANNMFFKCTSLKTIPQFDFSALMSLNGMFQGCDSLEYIPALDTHNVYNMNQVFGWIGESTRLGDNAQTPASQNSSTNYTLIHWPKNLKRVDGWDFSNMRSAPQNFFGGYASYSGTKWTPTSLPNLTHFIVNGVINFEWNTVGQGWWMLPNLDFDSIKSILEAMNRNDGTDMIIKNMLFNTTIMDDANGTLQSLYNECEDDTTYGYQRWVINGLNITPYGE